MKDKQRLIELLKHKRNTDVQTSILLLGSIFETAAYDTLTQEDKNWFISEKNNYEIVDFYLDIYEHNLGHNKKKFKNITTFDDVIELKNLLQEYYFTIDINDKVKINIVSILSHLQIQHRKAANFQ